MEMRRSVAHGGARPDVALFELRHKLASDKSDSHPEWPKVVNTVIEAEYRYAMPSAMLNRGLTPGSLMVARGQQRRACAALRPGRRGYTWPAAPIR